MSDAGTTPAPAKAPARSEIPARLEALRAAVLPCEQLGPEVLNHLRRPFEPEAVKWKVQTELDGGRAALIVAYIDARLVIERLNLVWPWWRPAFEPQGQGVLRCTLTLYEPRPVGLRGERVSMTRSDVGSGTDAKTLNSDALKRAGVGFGIGVSIYALKRITLRVGSGAAELRTVKKNKRNKQGTWLEVEVPIIDADTEAWLVGGYTRWLRGKGEQLFGPALGHGDELGSAGLDSESPAAAAQETGGEPAVEQAEEEAQQIEGERADELRKICAGLYGQFKKVAPRKVRNYTPATFQAKLLAAGRESLEALEALQRELEDLVRDNGGEV